jgi:endonuclease/exonuclease/phosphatase family metal-dependent hydrolase
MAPSTLRVATLNIWNRSGPWQERLESIRAELGALDPEILGLQEVLRQVATGESPHGAWVVPDTVAAHDAADQASAIVSGRLPHVAYASAMNYGGGLMFGNAVASRHPILEHAAFELPGRETGEVRSLLYALVDHPRGRLPVFVTHLNWKLHHGAVRMRQVAFVCERVKALAPLDGDTLPPVLMGDFNAEPDADEIRYLRGLTTIDGRSVYFADAWIYGGDGTPGYTFDRKNRFAAIAHEPPRRIDYIFVRGPDTKLRGEPLRTRLAFATPVPGSNGDVWPSDHFGLVTDLSVEPQSWG